MKTIIAEKPSVAREIARIVGAGKREEGYLTGNGYNVTWAFGHLVQPAMPEEYNLHGFVRSNLPIIPETFTLVPRQDGKRIQGGQQRGRPDKNHHQTVQGQRADYCGDRCRPRR